MRRRTWPGRAAPDVAPDAPPPDVAPTDGPSLAKDQFLTAYTNARCTYLARCGLSASLDACLASTSPSQYNLGLRYMLAAVDRGVTTYDPGAAAACVAWIAEQACAGTTPTTNASCGRIFVGTIPVGGTCLDSGECAPAGPEPPVCVPTTSCGCCTGTCSMVQVIAAGGSCAGAPGVIRRCADGQFCQTSTRTCVAVAALGQVCTSQGTQATCAPGLYCAYDQTVGGYRCFQPAPTGGTCPPADITGKPNCAEPVRLLRRYRRREDLHAPRCRRRILRRRGLRPDGLLRRFDLPRAEGARRRLHEHRHTTRREGMRGRPQLRPDRRHRPVHVCAPPERDICPARVMTPASLARASPSPGCRSGVCGSCGGDHVFRGRRRRALTDSRLRGVTGAAPIVAGNLASQ